MPDAIITELVSAVEEEPVAAFEFCGALPAGNNAWQRCGRALNLAYPKIPFFYFAELGGAELDSERKAKAGRTPNPLVPFAYLALGNALKTLVIPVFQPSPSITQIGLTRYSEAFGQKEAIALLNCLLKHEAHADKESAVKRKALTAIEILAGTRRLGTVLVAREWTQLAACESGIDKAQWLSKRKMSWQKLITIPKTKTVVKLYEAVRRVAVAVGTQDFPICLVPADKVTLLAKRMRLIYGKRIKDSFLDLLGKDGKPLVIVWVAGFKPEGSDSRPDRGLLPLARMIFGEDINVMSVVYGPANLPESVINNPALAAAKNGLWESIIRFSGGFILDSLTSVKLKSISVVVPEPIRATLGAKPELPAGNTVPLRFGEHDVDSALHTIFAKLLRLVSFECICNPPGGDWSGFSLQMGDKIHRWTSLPRVTALHEKRPDHVIQLLGSHPFLLSIESKESASGVERGIGPRLRRYVSSLLQFAPTIYQDESTNQQWRTFAGEHFPYGSLIVTAAAFSLGNTKELTDVLIRGECDVCFGFVFNGSQGKTILYVKTTGTIFGLEEALRNAEVASDGRLEIHIH